MRTKEQMVALLRAAGVTKEFKPYDLPEQLSFALEVNRPAKIVDGILHGVEIIFGQGGAVIWTDQDVKAGAYAKAHELKVRKFTGHEAELTVPGRLCDTILPQFGAKVKKRYSEASKAAASARLKSILLAKNPAYKPAPEA